MRRWFSGKATEMSKVRALRDGAVVAGLLFAVYLFVFMAPAARTFGFDAFAYWANPISDPYRLTTGAFGAFLYSPVAARLFAPAALVAWPTFLWLWTALLLGTAIWLGGRTVAVGPRLPAGRARAVPRQHPPPDRGGDRARLPVPGRVVLRAPDQGHARRLASSGSRCAGSGATSRSWPLRPASSWASPWSSIRGCGASGSTVS